VDFGTHRVGTLSAPRFVSITNIGDADFYIGAGNPWVLFDSTGSYSISARLGGSRGLDNIVRIGYHHPGVVP
jgi:hypothetical protein